MGNGEVGNYVMLFYNLVYDFNDDVLEYGIVFWVCFVFEVCL